MAGTQVIGAVQIKNDLGDVLARLERWPDPLPCVGDVVVARGAWGTVIERAFRDYGRVWAVTLVIDTAQKGTAYE